MIDCGVQTPASGRCINTGGPETLDCAETEPAIWTELSIVVVTLEVPVTDPVKPLLLLELQDREKQLSLN